MALKLKLEEIETQPDAKGLESAFQTAKQKQVGRDFDERRWALFHRKKADRRACRQISFAGYLPTKDYVDEGGLMSYGVDYLTSIGARLFTWTRS